MGGPWDVPNMDLEPGKSKWLAKGNMEEMSHIHDSNFHEGATQQLSLWACPVSIHTYCTLLLLVSSLLTSLVSVCVVILFCKAEEPGTCQWPLVQCLWFGALTTVTWLQYLAGNWSPVSSHCRLRPPEISSPKHLALKVNGACIHRVHKTIANEKIVLNELPTSRLSGEGVDINVLFSVFPWRSPICIT